MKKILLLLSLIATLCASCNKELKDEGTDTPVIPENPKLGYIDFANLWQIYLKDVATVQPKIKGTLVFDSTMSLGERILVYKHDIDNGVATTRYGFDHNGQLYVMFSKIVLDSLRTPFDVVNVDLRTVTSDLNTFTQSVKNSNVIDLSFTIYKKATNRMVKYIDLKSMENSSEPHHTVLWRYIDKYISNSIPEDEYARCNETMNIRDDVDQPDATTPYVEFILQAGTMREMFITVDRYNPTEPDKESDKRGELRNFVRYTWWRNF